MWICDSWFCQWSNPKQKNTLYKECVLTGCPYRVDRWMCTYGKNDNTTPLNSLRWSLSSFFALTLCLPLPRTPINRSSRGLYLSEFTQIIWVKKVIQLIWIPSEVPRRGCSSFFVLTLCLPLPRTPIKRSPRGLYLSEFNQIIWVSQFKYLSPLGDNFEHFSQIFMYFFRGDN